MSELRYSVDQMVFLAIDNFNIRFYFCDLKKIYIELSILLLQSNEHCGHSHTISESHPISH